MLNKLRRRLIKWLLTPDEEDMIATALWVYGDNLEEGEEGAFVGHEDDTPEMVRKLSELFDWTFISVKP